MRYFGVCTVILLLVLLYTQDAAAANRQTVERVCKKKFPPRPCKLSLGEGWYTLDDKRCMKVFKTPKEFVEAEETCEQQCGNLISIHNTPEFSEVLCLLMRSWPTKQQDIWIGAFRQDSGKYAWTDESVFKYTRWTKKQPDNFQGKEECAEMNKGQWGKWNDIPCSSKKPFVCTVTI